MLGQALRRRWPVHAFLICFAAADFFIINHVVGANRIGYAGVQINALKYAVVFCEFLAYNGEGLALALCAFLLFGHLGKNRNKFLACTCVFLLFIVPQIFVYAKSGLLSSQGRYVVPGSIGFSFSICMIASFLKRNPADLPRRTNAAAKPILMVLAFLAVIVNLLVLYYPALSTALLTVLSRAKGHAAADHWSGTLHDFAIRFIVIALASIITLTVFRKEKRRYVLSVLTACVMLLYCMMSAFACGRSFAREGAEVSGCMDEIARFAPDSSMIVVVADPGFHAEGITSVTRYLTLKKKEKNIRYWFFDAQVNNQVFFKEWKDTTLAHFGSNALDRIQKLESAKCLLFLKAMEKPFLDSNPGFNADWYSRRQWGDLVCYFRR